MQAKKLAVMILAIVASSAAWAQQDYPRDITLSWTNPTQNTDGTLIQPGELASIRLTCDRHDASNAFDVLVPITTQLPGEAMSHTEIGGIPQPGTYTCFGYAINIDDISSDASNPAVKKFTGKPLPPENMTVVVQ